MTMSSTRQRMLVCIDPERRPYAFEPVGNVRHLEKARFNALVINSVLSRENLELPMGLDLAWTLRNTLMGLGGWVACQEFLKAERDAIGMWTHPTPRTGTKLFEEHCIDPKLETRGNAWDLEFRYFNLQGGVEFWKAEGTRHQVGAYSAVEALPNGTFLVPYA